MSDVSKEPRDKTTDEITRADVIRDLMIEGIASQMRRGDGPPGPLPWWHLLDEEERDHWRCKALAHIEQVGWS